MRHDFYLLLCSIIYLSVGYWGYSLSLRQKVIFSGCFLYYYYRVGPFVFCCGDSFHLSNTFFLETLHFVQFYFQNKHIQVLWKLFSDRPSWALSVRWFAYVPQTSFLQKSVTWNLAKLAKKARDVQHLHLNLTWPIIWPSPDPYQTLTRPRCLRIPNWGVKNTPPDRQLVLKHEVFCDRIPLKSKTFVGGKWVFQKNHKSCFKMLQ